MIKRRDHTLFRKTIFGYQRIKLKIYTIYIYKNKVLYQENTIQ